jgi:hypothetical protein
VSGSVPVKPTALRHRATSHLYPSSLAHTAHRWIIFPSRESSRAYARQLGRTLLHLSQRFIGSRVLRMEGGVSRISSADRTAVPVQRTPKSVSLTVYPGHPAWAVAGAMPPQLLHLHAINSGSYLTSPPFRGPSSAAFLVSRSAFFVWGLAESWIHRDFTVSAYTRCLRCAGGPAREWSRAFTAHSSLTCRPSRQGSRSCASSSRRTAGRKHRHEGEGHAQLPRARARGPPRAR